MRALIYRLIGLVPVVLLLFAATVSYAQTQEQLDEVRAMEQKIAANQNNPNFDLKAAQHELTLLKQAYGMETPEGTQANPNNVTPTSSIGSLADQVNQSGTTPAVKQNDQVTPVSNRPPTPEEELADQIQSIQQLIAWMEQFKDDPRAAQEIENLKSQLEFLQGGEK